jgi:hypothetical protein
MSMGVFACSGNVFSQAESGRKLAEGVLTVVAPDQDAEDTALGPYDLDFLRNHPELEWSAPDFPENKPFFASPSETLVSLSKDVTFRHEVWGLEFSFKPARLIEVDLPTPAGEMERKVVWYMVYKVRYVGSDLHPKLETPDGTQEIPSDPVEMKREGVRFLPRFTIVSKERNLSIDAQILPAARDAIAARERVGKKLHDHIDISRLFIDEANLEADNSVWGVATWTDVDPRLDFFAIDVRGLTNAYKIRIDSEGKKNFDRKTLRIYFWRPGDALDVAQDKILLGLPAYTGPAPAEEALLSEKRDGLRSLLKSRKTEWSQVSGDINKDSVSKVKAQGIATEVVALQKEISSLDAQLRMKDALEQFNLKERLDYQWIYR